MALVYMVTEERVTLGQTLESASPSRPPDVVGRAIARLVPASWNGVGTTPVGWSRDWGFDRTEDGTEYVVSTEELASRVPELSTATTTRPRSAVGEEPTAESRTR